MPKYARGLNREVVAAINRGELSEPLTVASVRRLATMRGWNPPESLVLVALANAASDDHSSSYRKYFRSLGGGRHALREEFRGPHWRRSQRFMAT